LDFPIDELHYELQKQIGWLRRFRFGKPAEAGWISGGWARGCLWEKRVLGISYSCQQHFKCKTGVTHTVCEKMNLSAVPVIDIGAFRVSGAEEGSPIEARRSKVALQVKCACEQAGFFYVQNHGIPSALIREVFQMSRIFFERLNDDQKNSVDARTNPVFRGYISQATGLHTCNSEENDAYGEAGAPNKDHKESFTIGADTRAADQQAFASPMHGENSWPDEAMLEGGSLKGFRTTLEAYWRAMMELSRIISLALARSLALRPASTVVGEKDSFFLPYLTDPCAQMVLLRYPVQRDREKESTIGSPSKRLELETNTSTEPAAKKLKCSEQKCGKQNERRHKIGCGAHTDCGFLTILATDTIPGLQVCDIQRYIPSSLPHLLPSSLSHLLPSSLHHLLTSVSRCNMLTASQVRMAMAGSTCQ
jgi:isopenicillin N synthase-like dioxygenase